VLTPLDIGAKMASRRGSKLAPRRILEGGLGGWLGWLMWVGVGWIKGLKVAPI